MAVLLLVKSSKPPVSSHASVQKKLVDRSELILETGIQHFQCGVVTFHYISHDVSLVGMAGYHAEWLAFD